MNKTINRFGFKSWLVAGILLYPSLQTQGQAQSQTAPVDYVNPYIGNISHLLVPTYPTVHLPNSLLRVILERGDYTSATISGLPLLSTSHRGATAFSLNTYEGNENGVKQRVNYHTDQEKTSRIATR